jgi:endonuclease/exonuclease/phosphatase family metal-dependent hydrolase
MARTFSTFAKRLLITLHILATVVFLLACLAPYLNPQKWWPVSFAGLGFAIAFIIQVLFLFFWLIVSPRFAWLSVVSLLLGMKGVLSFFALHPGHKFTYRKPSGSIRVVHWNVARFMEWSRNNNKGSQTRLKMLNQIKTQNADVLCMEEFFHSTNKIYYDNITPIIKELGYKHFYFSWNDDGGDQWVGSVIFSKHPIIDSGTIHFPRPTMPDAMVYADINFNGKPIRVFTTHLQSVRFKKQDYESIEKVKNREDIIPDNSRNIFGKLKNGFILRSTQAAIVRNELNKSPYPVIITGDFNDVPNSYAYHTIRGDLQDTFLEKGFGVGRTFSFISPTLRIDYILASKVFTVEQFKREVKFLSDHYMLVADLKLRN